MGDSNSMAESKDNNVMREKLLTSKVEMMELMAKAEQRKIPSRHRLFEIGVFILFAWNIILTVFLLHGGENNHPAENIDWNGNENPLDLTTENGTSYLDHHPRTDRRDRRDMSYEDYKRFQRMDKVDAYEQKIDELQYQCSKIENTASKNAKGLQDVKDKSKYLSVCGYQDWVEMRNGPKMGVIMYDKMFHPLTQSPGRQHIFSPSTGMFTAGLDGVYAVSWDAIPHVETGGNGVTMFLRKNMRKLEETRHYSYSGYTRDQGGRTLLIKLRQSETLDLWCEDCRSTTYNIIFCVNLVHQ